jgi:hypothetical protein
MDVPVSSPGMEIRGKSMVIKPNPELEAALTQQARQKGIAPEELALDALKERFLAPIPRTPQDQWERDLLAAARNCGVSLSDDVLSREELYD